MLVIVDYGLGNLGSIKNMLKKIGVEAKISAEHEEIERAKRLILPGVGAFDRGMENLSRLGLIPLLNRKVLTERTPILGICLGMQLFTRGSEEGSLPGLGWIDADTVRFRFESDRKDLKVPHMGWNQVSPVGDQAIFRGIPSPRFYFVHSYRVRPDSLELQLGETRHGLEFTSAVRKDNIIGVQFHPEKSHKFGIQLFRNFMECC